MSRRVPPEDSIGARYPKQQHLKGNRNQQEWQRLVGQALQTADTFKTRYVGSRHPDAESDGVGRKVQPVADHHGASGDRSTLRRNMGRRSNRGADWPE